MQDMACQFGAATAASSAPQNLCSGSTAQPPRPVERFESLTTEELRRVVRERDAAYRLLDRLDVPGRGCGSIRERLYYYLRELQQGRRPPSLDFLEDAFSSTHAIAAGKEALS